MGIIRGAGSALVYVNEVSARAKAAGRGLYEGAEARPGRSDLAYMQHKYTPVDSRIIIITAAILLLLLAILFLNFFIRWAIHRFFLLRSPKPINPNKGLSKRQVQALPSFIYSSSLPSPNHMVPTPCGHPTFYPPFAFHPLSSHFCHALYPTSMTSTKVGDIDSQAPTIFKVEKRNHNSTSMTSTKVGDIDSQAPTIFEVDKRDHNNPSQLVSTQEVYKVDEEPPTKFYSLEGDQLVCTHVDAINNEPPTKLGSLEHDHALAGNHPFAKKEELVNNASSTKAIVCNVHKEDKGNSPTCCKGDSTIIDCTKDDKGAKHCDDTPSSSPPCPICLVEILDGETIRVLPSCRHYFHIGCIDLWLAKSPSCPACRANLLEVTGSPIKQSTPQVQVVTTISH